MRASSFLLLCAAVLFAACGPEDPPPPPSKAPCEGEGCAEEPAPPPPCVVEPIQQERELDPFYEKECVVLGIPVLGSGAVRDEALVAAAALVAGMLEHREDLAGHIERFEGRISLVAESENTTDVPEFAYLADDPDIDWNERARGFGATLLRPVTLAAEEDATSTSTPRPIPPMA